MSALSIVVVSRNSERELAALLDSVERQLDPRPQVIVVDADSSDGSRAVAEGRAELLALDANPGFGAASNAGLELARAEVTALLNPDVELLDDGLAVLAARARERDVLIAPRLLNPDGTVQRSAHPPPGRAGALLPALIHPRALPRGLRLRADPWRSHERREVGWAVAACLVARTALLRRLGPFDAERFLFYEDMDLCLRARAAGVATELHPDVAVAHAGRHSTDPAYGGEPYELLAERRRETVAANLGTRALALDDLAEGLTFATRAGARMLLRRDAGAERARLAALRRARRSVSLREAPADSSAIPPKTERRTGKPVRGRAGPPPCACGDWADCAVWAGVCAGAGCAGAACGALLFEPPPPPPPCEPGCCPEKGSWYWSSPALWARAAAGSASAASRHESASTRRMERECSGCMCA